ncbi:MAG: isochorismatase family protein [Candidatus Eremiobacteraeota bacterium]|nr:isochorismatase family protein [Candidatus Eremiobacteraeota bacterium]
MGKDFLEEIRRYNVRKAKPCKESLALLVIDMQEFFRPIAAPVLENVNALIGACRRASVPVIFTRHGHRDLSRDGGILAEWWGTLAMVGTPEWELLRELTVAEDEKIIDKMRYSAFHGTDLHQHLTSLTRDQLIITGVMTNCCCETTAREAFMNDYRVFFVSDATATADEELHLSSLRNLAYAFAHVESTKGLLEALYQD